MLRSAEEKPPGCCRLSTTVDVRTARAVAAGRSCDAECAVEVASEIDLIRRSSALRLSRRAAVGKQRVNGMRYLCAFRRS